MFKMGIVGKGSGWDWVECMTQSFVLGTTRWGSCTESQCVIKAVS